MKNGKKKVKKKTITVKVSSAKKVVVTAEPAKTTNKPTNGSTNGPTKEPVKRANSDTDCNINNRTVGNAYCNADRRTVGRANFNTDTNATS